MTRFFFLSIGITLCVIFFTSCASAPRGHFGDRIPDIPDYSLEKNWAALPARVDNADIVPVEAWKDEQSTSAADVFFIHPTTFTRKTGKKDWNASLDNARVNERTDQYPIRYQASIFNGAGKVYAPRYRQAHFNCFFIKRKKTDAAKALDMAYDDVRASFEYYLQQYNQGRPFIIASHSQGTYHGRRLIEEYVDEKPLEKQFITAYLAGLPVPADAFKGIKPCSQPDETGCFCSWRTFRKGYIPPLYHFADSNIVVTNPVTWSTDQPHCAKEDQLGAVLRDCAKVYPKLVSASIYKDLLWISRPKFPGSFLFTTKNYHIADYNFFYADVRQNAQARVKAYFGKG